MTRKIVQFIKPSGIYNAGEKAGFLPEQAERFVKAGIATMIGDAERSVPRAERPAAKHPGSTFEDDRNAESRSTKARHREGRTAVKFLKHWEGYIPGDVAGVGPKVAENLIRSEIAIPAEGGVEAKKGGDTKAPKNVDYASMKAKELRAAVKALTGESPKTKNAAIASLTKLGVWNG